MNAKIARQKTDKYKDPKTLDEVLLHIAKLASLGFSSLSLKPNKRLAKKLEELGFEVLDCSKSYSWMDISW